MSKPPRRPETLDGPVYEARTGDVVVKVTTRYIPEQSEPEHGQYFWSYTVEIENKGAQTLQLMARHWVITDSFNRVHEVQGDGVVGEQPELKPGDAFRYTSGCPLKTASGTMRGSYRMLTAAGESFEAAVPEFSLHLPGAGRVVN